MKWPFKRVHITPPDEARERDRYVEISLESARQAKAETSRRLEESHRIRRRIVAHNDANAYGLWMETLLAQAQRKQP